MHSTTETGPWWHMPIISALGKWRPEDALGFKVILGSEFAASLGLPETLSKTKQRKARVGRRLSLSGQGRAVHRVK